MNNQKVKEIIKFSFYKNLQNKWFVLFNIITLLSIILIVNWGSIVSFLHPQGDDSVFEVAVLDQENLIFDDFTNSFLDNPHFKITRIPVNTYTAETIPDHFMVVEVKPNEEEIFTVVLISKEGIELENYNPVKDVLFSVRNHLLMQKYSIEKDQLEIVQRDLTIERIMLGVDADNSSTKEFIKLFSAAFTYLITVFIFSKMANEIASEKQSKATEYLLTTVSAKEYLFAKIFSSIAVLLLQGLLMLVYYFIAALLFNISHAAYTDITISSSFISSSVSKDIIRYIIALFLYNVLNLILLCIIQATVASKTSSTAEAGNTTSILLLIMMASYVATIYFLKPYTKVNLLLYIISCIPLLSAYFVPGMMVIGQATLWQIIISLLLLIISIPFTFHYCAAIFKNGILDYTNRMKKKPQEKKIDETKKKFLLQRKMKQFGFVIGISIILYVGIQMVVSLVGDLILTSLLENVLTKSAITLLLQMILQVFSLGIISAFVFAYTNCSCQIPKKPILRKTKLEIVLIAIFVVFALQLFLSLVLYPFLGLDYNTTDLFEVDASSHLITKIILILAISITPAIFEELFFRKAIMNYTLPFGKVFTLLFSALFFGMMHMNLSQGLFAFIMGLILGSIYLYTGDIKLTMLIHCINNGFAALELIMPTLGVIVVTAAVLILILVGFVLTIKRFAKKEFRERFYHWCKLPVNLQAIPEKYIYVFQEYTFDVSLLLLLLMSFATEKMLR